MTHQPSLNKVLVAVAGCIFLAVGLIVTGLVACARMEAQWRALMEAAGLVDWQPLAEAAEVRVRIVCLALLLLLCAGGGGRVLVLGYRRRLAFKKEIVLLTLLGVLLVAISSVGVSTFSSDECPQKALVAALSTQRNAVASFNRHMCLAWCRTNASSAMASSCAFDEAPAAAEFVTNFSVGNWCERAIEASNFTANNVPGSPFEQLAGVTTICEPLDAWHIGLFLVFVIALIFSCCLPVVGIFLLVEEFCMPRTPVKEKPMLAMKLVESSASGA